MARRLTKDPPDWCKVSTVEDNLMHWQAVLTGPENSPYEGGVFNLDMQFPSEYPFKAPRVRFVTRVYHPNIKSQSGEICADIISQVLEQPDMDNPLEPEIAKQMHENKVEFDKTAMEWTKQYAC
uniref:UBC core domain-containing protein n=1 Tax=Hyaloperonospora arabidopsidis (strain Emoy2) TaxID=559515 RepID=M4B188_HYAAE